MKSKPIILSLFASGIILSLSYFHILPIDVIETLGFLSGAATVWLTVKQNIWCWPIGIANNIFFIILFLNAHLFADMALQIVYIILSILGWYWWLRGGKGHNELNVSRISLTHASVLLVITILSTYAVTLYLESIHDAAPFFDALTTVISLVAQYLLTRKYLENWYVWISADIIYIGLYFYKNLYLTGALYIIFFIMCVIGLRAWRNSILTQNSVKEKI